MVVEVQQNFILFIYVGVPQVKFHLLLFYLFLSNFINQFHKFIVFFSCHFFFQCSLILLVCGMERQKGCMLIANRTCLLHGYV